MSIFLVNMALLVNRFLHLSNKIIKERSLLRTITTTKHLCANYEGDGKTTVTILNRQYRHLVMIDSLSSHGFRLNNGVFVIGPVAAFPRTILQWNVPDVESITPESLSLFALLEPKLDIFILGTGDKTVMPKQNVLQFFKERKISVEILNTEKACSTFNFLNAEGRCVAGAFLPPVEVQIHEEEMQFLDRENADHTGYIM